MFKISVLFNGNKPHPVMYRVHQHSLLTMFKEKHQDSTQRSTHPLSSHNLKVFLHGKATIVTYQGSTTCFTESHEKNNSVDPNP